MRLMVTCPAAAAVGGRDYVMRNAESYDSDFGDFSAQRVAHRPSRYKRAVIRPLARRSDNGEDISSLTGPAVVPSQQPDPQTVKGSMINLVLALGLIPVLLVLRRFYHSHFAPTFLEKLEGGVPRPPLVADWVPFVGNALSMTRGDAFWAGVIRRYGPVVRVRAMGEVGTFVTTPGVSQSFLCGSHFA